MSKNTIKELSLYALIAVLAGFIAYQATIYVTSQSVRDGSSVFTRATTSLTELIQAESQASSTGGSVHSNAASSEAGEADTPNQGVLEQTDSGRRETVTLAGGCFWCTEAYLQETAGVVSAVSGYAGGSEATANYKQVTKGDTAHRESVQVVFDPARVSLSEILEAYWTHIDPTDEGGQFADRGFHYTTAIFYHNENQRQVAEKSKLALASSGLFTSPIATEILPFSTFFEAEEYHQDYYKKASGHYERYKKGSGRAGFIEDNWAKEAALEFFESQEQPAPTVDTTSAAPASDMYIERDWSESEIASGLSLLSADVYRIVAEDGTERAFQNEYYDHKEAGLYVDVVTGRPLYSSTHKYDSGTGWPSFYRAIDDSVMVYQTDNKLVLPRTEVRSESGHLGHVFTDGPDEHGGKRHCINSLALDFVPLAELEDRGYGDYLYLF